MKTLKVCFTCLALAGCGVEDLNSITTEPVARFQIIQQRDDESGSQTGCGTDPTGLLPVNYYEGLADDVLVIGHRTTGADNRCRIDIHTRLNGHVAFDLSALSALAPGSTGTRQIKSALLAARIRSAPNFDGGRAGCRTSRRGVGVGMLDYVFWLIRDEFFPLTTPDLSNPPKTRRIGILRLEDREVRLNGYLVAANPPVEIAASVPGAMTLSLDSRALAALQRMVNENSNRLRRFGLYFVGTNGGSTASNQTCLQYFEDIQLTVFFKEGP